MLMFTRVHVYTALHKIIEQENENKNLVHRPYIYRKIKNLQVI